MNPWNLLLDALGGVLAFFYDLIPSYGIAIILLTLAVSLLLFPLTLKQTRSMRAMQEIQPEVKRLQKEYKDNREEMQKQLMALYQERGVNPAAGCLPLLLQMPIWFALFSVLRSGSGIPEGSALFDAVNPAKELLANGVSGVDLSDAVFNPVEFLTMNLLISPSDAAGQGLVNAIPYIILILIVMAAGFYQQWQTTRRNKENGNQQQGPQGMQTALKFMPLFFGFISWGFPTGLVLYFATSNLFRIAQQAVILRMGDGSAVKTPSDEAKASGSNSGGSGQDPAPPAPPESSGPSPHASKKRKKRRRK